MASIHSNVEQYRAARACLNATGHSADKGGATGDGGGSSAEGSTASAKGCYIGLWESRDEEDKEEWSWVDGTRANTRMFWANGEPNNAYGQYDEQYAAMMVDHAEWDDFQSPHWIDIGMRWDQLTHALCVDRCGHEVLPCHGHGTPRDNSTAGREADEQAERDAEEDDRKVRKQKPDGGGSEPATSAGAMCDCHYGWSGDQCQYKVVTYNDSGGAGVFGLVVAILLGLLCCVCLLGIFIGFICCRPKGGSKEAAGPVAQREMQNTMQVPVAQPVSLGPVDSASRGHGGFARLPTMDDDHQEAAI
jgi:hypothetical protein